VRLTFHSIFLDIRALDKSRIRQIISGMPKWISAKENPPAAKVRCVFSRNTLYWLSSCTVRTLHTMHLSARSGVMCPGRTVIPEKPRARVRASPATPWSWRGRDQTETRFSSPDLSFWGRISSWPNLLKKRYSIRLHGNAGVKFDSALVSWLSLKF